MAAPSILLRGGTLLIHDEDDHVVARIADLLIEGDIIVKIDETIFIDPSSHIEVIDCTDKIISPGFIDTHHHLWQTQLKGRHGDDTLLDYMSTGNLSNSRFKPIDIFWGQLGGALEAINSGTTTVVDHAHMNYSEDHTNCAIGATLTSGIRSVFCYTPTPIVTAWKPHLTVSPEILGPWVIPLLNTLSNKLDSHPLISIGLAFDAYALLTPAGIKSLFTSARSAGCQVITAHFARSPVFGAAPSTVKTLYDLDLLGRDILFSHASSATADDMRMIQEKHVSVSCTPSTEIQMGLGAPLAFEDRLTGSVSLGCDSHSVVRGSMIEQMRVALLDGRWERTKEYLERGAYPRQEKPSVEDAFNLATVAGAKAIGMSEEVGRLRVGYKADVLVWGGQSPSMVCAAKQNPLTAVVAHAGTSDLEYVIVGGVVRKREGKLVRLQVERLQKGSDDELSEKMEYIHNTVGESDTLGPALGRKLEWLDVAKELEKSREGIDFRIKEAGIDTEQARDEVAALFGLNTKIVED